MNINEECLLRFLNNPERLSNCIKELQLDTTPVEIAPDFNDFIKHRLAVSA